MLRFDANLSFLFQELPFFERFGAAAACGFRGVEYMSPYEYEIAEIRRALDSHGLEQVLFNLPVGDFAAGERGIACDPGRVAEFRRGVGDAVAVARELGCTRINCLAGIERPDVPPLAAHETLLENLRFAGAALREIGATLLIEPLNRIETPGFVVGTPSEGFALIAEAAVPNLALQYDVYHAQRAEGNVLATLRAHGAAIRHVQIADSPGRNEPGTGELAYERILPSLEEFGYDGWIGCEYRPSLPVPQTFAWRDALLDHRKGRT